MSNEFVRLDVELLLCRYGRQKVLSTLAEIEGCDLQAVQQQLAIIQRKKASRNKLRKQTSLIDLLEKGLSDSPDRVALIRPFIVAYEGRTFLPSLKSVQRFLESKGEPASGLKSRKAAGPAVLGALARMDRSELELLPRSEEADDQSDFALLSRAILRSE